MMNNDTPLVHRDYVRLAEVEALIEDCKGWYPVEVFPDDPVTRMIRRICDMLLADIEQLPRYPRVAAEDED